MFCPFIDVYSTYITKNFEAEDLISWLFIVKVHYSHIVSPVKNAQLEINYGGIYITGRWKFLPFKLLKLKPAYVYFHGFCSSCNCNKILVSIVTTFGLLIATSVLQEMNVKVPYHF